MKNDESSSSDDSDVESDSSDEESKDQPVLQISSIPHFGTINRIRVSYSKSIYLKSNEKVLVFLNILFNYGWSL